MVFTVIINVIPHMNLKHLIYQKEYLVIEKKITAQTFIYNI